MKDSRKKITREEVIETLEQAREKLRAVNKVEAVVAERGLVYGDPYISHRSIGLAFSGLIEHHYGIKLTHPIPASLVARMMLALKNQRASLVYHADNFTDAKAYLGFAEEFQQREQNGA